MNKQQHGPSACVRTVVDRQIGNGLSACTINPILTVCNRIRWWWRRTECPGFRICKLILSNSQLVVRERRWWGSFRQKVFQPPCARQVRKFNFFSTFLFFFVVFFCRSDSPIGSLHCESDINTNNQKHSFCLWCVRVSVCVCVWVVDWMISLAFRTRKTAFQLWFWKLIQMLNRFSSYQDTLQCVGVMGKRVSIILF